MFRRPKTKPRTKNKPNREIFTFRGLKTFADELRKFSRVASFEKFREYKLSLATTFQDVEINKKKINFM